MLKANKSLILPRVLCGRKNFYLTLKSGIGRSERKLMRIFTPSKVEMHLIKAEGN